MSFRPALFAVFVALSLAPVALADTISPNTTTPVGPGFNLDTTAPAGTTGLILPCWFAGLVQQPSNGTANQTLDLTNPLHPVLNDPADPARGSSYSLFFGIDLTVPTVGQEVVLAFEEGNPDQPIIVGSVYNAAQNPLSATLTTFNGNFQLSTGGIAITSWKLTQFQDTVSGAQDFRIDFTLASPATTDPSVTFSLSETVNANTFPLGFTPEETVPEPATLGLLAAGLATLVLPRRRQ